jgi:hypothetical protein
LIGHVSWVEFIDLWEALVVPPEADMIKALESGMTDYMCTPHSTDHGLLSATFVTFRKPLQSASTLPIYQYRGSSNLHRRIVLQVQWPTKEKGQKERTEAEAGQDYEYPFARYRLDQRLRPAPKGGCLRAIGAFFFYPSDMDLRPPHW